MNLTKLLKPEKIAVIGASKNEGFGGDTCRNIINNRENLNSVYLVNPKRNTLYGQKCYASITEIEGTIDLVIICTPKQTVNGILRQSSEKGAGAAVVFASGYGETGTPEGKALEEELLALAQELGILLMGPNCAGFSNFVNEVFAFGLAVAKKEKAGKIGLISQSGQLCASALDIPIMNFSYIIASGNSKNVTVEDYIDFLVEDEATKVVAVYMEGINKTARLAEVFRKAAEKKKPIVMLKTGRSVKGRQLTASHTGSLANSDSSVEAFFKKFGVIRVNDIEELLYTAIMFDTLASLPGSAKFASANVSGGESAVIADIAYLNGVEFADISKDTLNQLKEVMPSYATPNNPLDMTATLAYDTENLAKALEVMMKDETVGALLVGWTVIDKTIDDIIYHITEAIELVSGKPWTKPILLVPFVEHTRDPQILNRLYNVGVPILPSGMYAFRILKYLSDFVRFDAGKKTLKIAVPNDNSKREAISLSENKSKQMLKEYGIFVPPSLIVSNELQLVAAAEEIGYPLVLKIESDDILHKSDVGGVKLNIVSTEMAVAAFHEILANVEKNAPEADINGILVQKMLPKGIEVIVGVNNDPQFGPMIMAGLGGVFVEVFKDVVITPAPISKAEALDAIAGLKAFKLLNGYRGEKRADIPALADFIVKISEFAAENKNIVKELDINPVFVYPEGEGIAVADALIVRYQETNYEEGAL